MATQYSDVAVAYSYIDVDGTSLLHSYIDAALDRSDEMAQPAGSQRLSLKERLKFLSHSELQDLVLELSKEFPQVSRYAGEHLSDKRAESSKLYTNKNWNVEFQDLRDGIDDNTFLDQEKTFSSLSALSQDFVNAAKTYGKIIISELYGNLTLTVAVPVAYKTIKPVAIGGVAGGEKYIVQNILFKFAIDVHNLFPSNIEAGKLADHDLKGFTAHYPARSESDCQRQQPKDPHTPDGRDGLPRLPPYSYESTAH